MSSEKMYNPTLDTEPSKPGPTPTLKEEVRTNIGRARKEKEKEMGSTASSKTSKEWTFVEIESNST